MLSLAFGENVVKNPTITTPGELYAIIEDAGNNIHDIRICSDDVVEVDISKVEEEVIPSSTAVQVFRAAERASPLFRYRQYHFFMG